MVFFPNCKINLGLKILRKRPDGYHDLETVFYPLPLKDVLEVVRAGELHFSASGIPIPGGNADENLCLRAWRLLKEDIKDLPPVHIYLYKQIPIGAGLGGGSADGAFMLRLLDACFHLELGQEKLLHYAARLGSDCPFFILNKPCLGGGRGEQLEALDLDLSRYSFLLVHPGIHISTARAFSQIQPALPKRSLREIIQQPVISWATELVNDFEAPALREHPELGIIREKLYGAGALYAAMTGSGSSFFGIFEKDKAPSISFEQNYQVTSIR